MKKRAVKYKARQDDVYDTICDRILQGAYPAGMRLREEALAEEFGVSRTPIREVFRLLTAVGLVKLVPNRGALVEGFTPDDIEELYDIRRGLEALAIEYAAPVIPLVVLERFRDGIRALARTADADAHARLDQEFHNMLHEQARRRRLTAMLQQQYHLMQHFRHMGFRSPAQIRQAGEEHLAIIEALMRRDTAAAIRAMNVHLINSKRIILSMLTTDTSNPSPTRRSRQGSRR
jgi:DNA-binding GntR family transcriptional regulator